MGVWNGEPTTLFALVGPALFGAVPAGVLMAVVAGLPRREKVSIIDPKEKDGFVWASMDRVWSVSKSSTHSATGNRCLADIALIIARSSRLDDNALRIARLN